MRATILHYRSIRLYNNGGMTFPTCYASAERLDLDKARLSSTGDRTAVTCKRCLRIMAEDWIAQAFRCYQPGPRVPVPPDPAPIPVDLGDLDPFTRAYLHAAAWTTDPEPGSGEYPEPAIEDLDPGFVRESIADCADFQAANGDAIAEDLARAGSDFWLTRNGHGAGFWDGDWPEAIGEALTAASKPYGSVDGPVWADARDFGPEVD